MINAQSFEDEWQAINKELDSGKVKTAEPLIREIFSKAKKQKNSPAMLKCIMHLSVLTENAGELNDIAIIQSIAGFSDSVETKQDKALIHLFLAQALKNYVHYHRQDINQRGYENFSITEYSKLDQWPRSLFFKAIDSSIRKAMQDSTILLNTPARTYSELFRTKPQSEQYRPTLFDIIAFASISLYESLEQDIDRIYRPMCTDTRVLSHSAEFLRIIPNEVSGFDITHGTIIQRIQLYQSILRNHAKDNDATAFTDADIHRLLGLFSTFEHEFKDSLLTRGLLFIGNNANSALSKSNALYEAALHYANIEQNKKAVALCESIQQQFPRTFAAEQSSTLLGRLKNKSLSLSMQQFILPNKPFIFRTDFANVEKIFCRIYLLNESIEQKVKQRRYRDRFWTESGIQELMNMQPVQAWKQELPKVDDFREHGTWKKGPPLKKGTYIMLLSDSPVFKQSGDNMVAYHEFTVSPVTAIIQKEHDGTQRLHVMDAEQGLPAKARVLIMESTYDQNNNTYTDIENDAFNTDEQGTVIIPPVKEESYVRDRSLKIITEDDSLVLDHSINRFTINSSGPSEHIQLFSDRQLYRPGQTVMFKGIVFTKEQSDSAKIQSQKDIMVRFVDSRGKVLDSTLQTTNHLGSISGSFFIPNEILPGFCSLQTDLGAISFRVDEYKRPTFEISFQDSSTNMILGKEARITGIAKTFSGSNLVGAKVKYTVSRMVSFPCKSQYRSPITFPRKRDIAYGLSDVNANGEFSISFTAMADPSVSMSDAPWHSFQISVDVIASNGEMQRADTVIEIGSLNALYAFRHKQIISTSEKQLIQLSCTLNNGKPAKGMKGNIIVERLEKQRLKLPLPFEFGDTEGISQKDKELLFPHEQFDKNDQPTFRKAESVVYSQSLESNGQGLITPTLPSLLPGTYRIRYSAENGAMPFSIESTWSVIDKQSSTMQIDEHLLLIADTNSLSVGDTARCIIGSGWNNASVLIQIESKGYIVSQERMMFSESMRQFTVPITKQFRGGISIHCSMIKHGRLITKSLSIDVPWKEKNISLKTKTLRSKTEPGSKEEWSFSVKHPIAQQPIEVLGIVYDASLDKLSKPISLTIPYLWESQTAEAQPTSLTMLSGNGSSMFGDRWNEHAKTVAGLREFDELNLDILLGGVFGRTEIMYYDDMVMSKNMMMSESAMVPAAQFNTALNPVIDGGFLEKQQQSKPRISFRETAYFNPFMQVDSGNALLQTTIPDALTRWNIKLFAHSDDMSFGNLDTSIISQKPFMVSTHVPRFLRSGDDIRIRATINVLESSKPIETEVFLTYMIDNDSSTIRKLTSTCIASKSAPGAASWNITIPKGSQIHFTIGAISEQLEDAESHTLPILPNSNIIVDGYPIWIDANKNGKQVITPVPATAVQSMSIQLSTEPFWYAVEALPDLLAPSFGSTLDQANRLLAAHLARTYILENSVIRNALKDSLFKGRMHSPLTKSLIGEQVDIGPWESDIRTQKEQAEHLYIYADSVGLARIADQALNRLQTMQSPDGAFPWFASMPSSAYITRHILALLGVNSRFKGFAENQRDLSFMIDRSISWLDEQMTKDMNAVFSTLKVKDSFRISLSDIHYLYARSFFLQSHPLPSEDWMPILNEKMWNNRMRFGPQVEAMIALILHRTGEQRKADAMLRSLMERAVQDDAGTHWQVASTSWHDADIETHALALMAFKEISPNSDIANGILRYMIRQKQVRHWGSASATLSAVMSILASSETCSGNASNVSVAMNGEPIILEYAHFPGVIAQKISESADVKKLEVSVTGNCPIWGGAFRKREVQLSEEFSSAEQDFQMKRTYHRIVHDSEQRIMPVKEGETLHLGETILVRLHIQSPMAMNYVFIQDLFPGCFDIMANNSEYRHFRQIWAYSIPRDSGMNFFVDYLPKGKSMLEYEVKVDKSGVFSRGMVKATSLFAPEFRVINGGGTIVIAP